MIIIHPLIDPVIFSFSFIEIRWYGFAYVLGFIIGIYLIKYINKNLSKPINSKFFDDLFIWSILGVIIGGRIGYILFYQTNTILNNPIHIFYIWEGGMSFHGGLIGIIISIFIFSKIKKVNFFYLSDLISIAAPIGIFFGRIANFINVELYGRSTNFPFAIIYPSIDGDTRHPSQLYEAFFEGLILFIILFITSKYFLKNKMYGVITSLFLIFYGIFRFLLEFLREPDPQIGFLFNFLTLGQILSVPMIMFGIIILWKKNWIK
ncbi:MAG: Prolipoprotein diacylglyceryl transferase [Alphaproteobacteria bacterium MarineAlpha5_Bin9]|nr:MAG: Prolipoprotein diacylglyceryl transferase [Alphaproteobacteria bacterium MarineAlpha5_Bin9]|tara:strand:+ start:4506 stop:5294 length:789 start_codon:yes stop_codon:yes gene_type:complete